MNKFLIRCILIFSFLMFFPLQKVEAVQPLYKIKVDLTNNLIFIEIYNEKTKLYEPTEHVFLASVGQLNKNGVSLTPIGNFVAKPLIDSQYSKIGEWYRFRSYTACYVNYVTQFQGNYLFHGIPVGKPSYPSITKGLIAQMGQHASSGCIRLFSPQAAWIYYNCSGAKVSIYYGEETKEKDAIRKRLLSEVPSTKEWPRLSITENTKYWYFYHGDNLEDLLAVTGLTEQELQSLNPGLNIYSLTVGTAIRIKE